jgi:MFS family permease
VESWWVIDVAKANRFLTSLLMQVREYKHRLGILGIVVVLLFLFFLSSYYSSSDEITVPFEVDTTDGIVEMEVPASSTWVPITGLMGVAWAVAIAAFYAMAGSVNKDKRLILCGYRSWQILIARLTILIGIAFVVSWIPLSLVVPTLPFERPGVIWLSGFLVGLISIIIGMFIAAVLPRPTEGVLIIIMFFGITMSISGTDAAQIFPTYYATTLFYGGLFVDNPNVLPNVAYSIAVFFTLLALTIVLWSLQVRIKRWP